MSTDREKKIDDGWLAVLRGDVVTNLNKTWQLNAKLIRSIIQERREARDQELNIGESKRLERYMEALVREGILKDKKKLTKERFTKWIAALLFGASVVWAANELIRVDSFLQTEESPTTITNKVNKPFAYITDKYGSFTGFWSKLQLRILSPARFDEPFELQGKKCGPEHLSLSACLAMAEQGDKNAQFNMGLMYEKGINVPQDNQKAKDWYKKAAARGSHAANINLNYMFENVD